MSARIRIHDDGYGRLRLRWYADDSAQWYAILEDFKETFSRHSERSYSAGTKTWSVPLWCRHRLEDWADYWFDTDAQQWEEEEEPAGRTYGRSYTGNQSGYGHYRQHTSTRTTTVTVEHAYRTLHLYPTAPPELVQAAHRVMVKLSHPDSGGSHEAAVAVNAAWEVIAAHQQQERQAS